ncbi:MAG TPA: GNAT family N-acetyltransferase [Allosphingosinicella sp.]|jgi:RimJ/RimL family protein N-acetyltransferase
MTLRLAPMAADVDVEALARALAPGFGGEEDAAHEILAQTVALLTREPRADPWGSYLSHEGETPVGMCAFKWAPDAEGTVEIAYMTFPAFERLGHANAMIDALTDIARGAGARRVIAHTLMEENASNQALRRNEFAFAGEVEDPEDGMVWRWEREP